MHRFALRRPASLFLVGALLLLSACTNAAGADADSPRIDGFGELKFEMSPAEVRDVLERRGSKVLVDSPSTTEKLRAIWMGLAPPISRLKVVGLGIFDEERFRYLRLEYHGPDSPPLTVAECHALFAKVLGDFQHRYGDDAHRGEVENLGVNSIVVRWTLGSAFAFVEEDFHPARNTCLAVGGTVFDGNQAALKALMVRIDRIDRRDAPPPP